MNHKIDTKLYDLLSFKNPDAILKEIKHILSIITCYNNFKSLDQAYEDTVKLFNGLYPGFSASNTKYHDLEHSASTALTVTRLIHGCIAEGYSFDPQKIFMGISAALFHDVGLIQTIDDTEGTGAKYTIGHEKRSIDFFTKYFKDKNYSLSLIDDSALYIQCTILNLPPKQIPFKSEESRSIGYIIGSSDLLTQISDRNYLEKLILLFKEFEEAGIPDFESELDLLRKTERFYNEVAQKRLFQDFEGICSHMKSHFRQRWGLDKDLYSEAIASNIEYIKRLANICKEAYECYLDNLKRGGISETFIKGKNKNT